MPANTRPCRSSGDARADLEELRSSDAGYRGAEDSYRAGLRDFRDEWEKEVDRIYGLRIEPPISQGEVIGVVNRDYRGQRYDGVRGRQPSRDLAQTLAHARPTDTTWSMAIPAWATKSPAAWVRRWRDPEREVYVMVGDGSYLMMAQEIVTSVQEGYKLNIVLLDNHGFSSIGGLSRACGNRGNWAPNIVTVITADHLETALRLILSLMPPAWERMLSALKPARTWNAL